jgi:hypothetical protein
MHMRAPRNAPCPCGSGRKYKNCCYRLDAARDRSEERLLAATDVLMRELPKYAINFGLRGPIVDAAEEFETSIEVEDAADLVEYLESTEGQLFIDWFIYDYELLEGGTVLKRFIRERGAWLRTLERELAASWLESPLTVIEVKEIIPGWGFTAEDLLLERSLRIHDIAGAEQISEGTVLIARPLPVDSFYILTGFNAMLFTHQKETLLKRLEQAKTDYLDRIPQATVNDFLKDEGYIYFSMMTDNQFRNIPRLVTAEGDPLELVFTLFSVEDGKALAKALETAPGIECAGELEDGKTPPLIEYLFSGEEDTDQPEPVFDPEDEDANLEIDFNRRLLGTFKLCGNYLLFEGHSLQRRDRAVAL